MVNYKICCNLRGSELPEGLVCQMGSFMKADYVNYKEQKTGMHRSQFEVESGALRDFEASGEYVAKIMNKINEVGYGGASVKFEIVLFCRLDNQTLRLPRVVTETATRCGYGLEVTFFRVC
jgi:hypothetical protein